MGKRQTKNRGIPIRIQESATERTKQMFDFFKKRRISEYTNGAAEYLRKEWIPAPPEPWGEREKMIAREALLGIGRRPPYDDGARYALPPTGDDTSNDSARKENQDTPPLRDPFSTAVVDDAMRGYRRSASVKELLRNLDKTTNETFVDALLTHIKERGLRPAEVYRAARIDRRLFSKMVSDRQYTPSKDTAIALALALKLTLDEATDLLSRAGYSLSHSNKKDIIVEYFIREQIYKLDDINEVLYNLEQKIIGK